MSGEQKESHLKILGGAMVIGICDDYELTREAEIKYLEQLEEEIGVEFEYVTFGSGEEVLAYRGAIDILLLDIELPGINGIDTMRVLEDYDNVRAILFVTGYDSYMGEAYSTKTYGFIHKPIKYECISKEIRIILNKWERKQRKIELTTVDGPIMQILDDIMYVYAEKNYVRLFAKNRDYLLYGNLKNWQVYFEQYNIIRVHKSYLVNLENVLDINKDVELKDMEKHIPLGRKYRDSGRQLYNEYRFKRIREEFLL